MEPQHLDRGNISELAQRAADQLGVTELRERPVNTGFDCGYIGLIGETGGMFVEVEAADNQLIGQVVLWCETCEQYYHPIGAPLLGTMLDIAAARRLHRRGIEPCFDCDNKPTGGRGQVIDLTSRVRRQR
jgi:hypothetical protein